MSRMQLRPDGSGNVVASFTIPGRRWWALSGYADERGVRLDELLLAMVAEALESADPMPKPRPATPAQTATPPTTTSTLTQRAQTHQEAIELLSAGERPTMIASQLGRSAAWVYGIRNDLIAAGVQLPDPDTVLDRRIADAILAKRDPAQIVADLSTSSSRVARVRRELIASGRLSKPAPAPRGGVRSARVRDAAAEAKELLLAGKDNPTIAAALGRHHTWVSSLRGKLRAEGYNIPTVRAPRSDRGTTKNAGTAPVVDGEPVDEVDRMLVRGVKPADVAEQTGMSLSNVYYRRRRLTSPSSSAAAA